MGSVFEVLFTLGWIACGVLAYGIAFAAHQRSDDYLPHTRAAWRRRNMALSVFIGLFGPIGLMIIYFVTGFAEHGLKFK